MLYTCEYHINGLDVNEGLQYEPWKKCLLGKMPLGRNVSRKEHLLQILLPGKIASINNFWEKLTFGMLTSSRLNFFSFLG